ncbi:MAG: hypothetical protein HC890_00050 [Chloroflexaceae bacterium]|nr:hypothetical protein [Chloroflexaceae bacterium]
MVFPPGLRPTLSDLFNWGDVTPAATAITPPEDANHYRLLPHTQRSRLGELRAQREWSAAIAAAENLLLGDS